MAMRSQVPWWVPEVFDKKKPYLKKRMEIIRSIRRYFDEKEFWEVETPALQVSPTADTHIHGIKAALRDVNLNPRRDLYLHSSPEFAMKKLLVAGLSKIYQICHVFRDGDGGTPFHSPEFTMIEWYRADATYHDIIDDCVYLLRVIATVLEFEAYTYSSYKSVPFLEWEIISVSDVFEKYVGIEIDHYLNDGEYFGEVEIRAQHA